MKLIERRKGVERRSMSHRAERRASSSSNAVDDSFTSVSSAALLETGDGDSNSAVVEMVVGHGGEFGGAGASGEWDEERQ